MRRQLAFVSPPSGAAPRSWLAAVRECGLLTCLALISFAVPELVAACPAARPSARPAGQGGVCTGAVQHPLEVRVIPTGSIRRGDPLTLEVRVTSRAPVSNAVVRVVSTGGATLRGPARLALDGLAPGRGASGRFEIQVPREGHRFLVQFLVTGEGAAGVIARGATYNVLPDGPADPGRRVTTPSGTTVLEFAARRVGR